METRFLLTFIRPIAGGFGDVTGEQQIYPPHNTNPEEVQALNPTPRYYD